MTKTNFTLRIKMKDGRVRNFTEKMQEPFLLRYIGLMNKEISVVLNGITEAAVTKRLERSLDFFEMDGSRPCIEAAISIAAKNGLGDFLVEKYREKHRVHIEKWERAVKNFTIVGGM
jgi:hypothetical protein